MKQRTLFAGADVGCNYAKIYGGEGKKVAITSTVSTKPQVGVSMSSSAAVNEIVVSINDNVYAVGPRVADPIDTRFADYYTSDINAALALAAMIRTFGDLSDAEIHAVFGLPLNVFYNTSGRRNDDLIKRRSKAWRQHASILRSPANESLPRDGSVFGRLSGASEGVAVYLDWLLDEEGREKADAKGMTLVVDIGGNTTDIALLEDGQLLFGGASTSFEVGALHLYERVAAAAKDLMGLARTPTMTQIEKAIREDGGHLNIGNNSENIRDLVAAERRAIVNELIPRIQKVLSKRIDEVETVLFAGGTSKLLDEDLKGVRVGKAKTRVVEDPQFANARGYYKLARAMSNQE